jgi:hypothetical protein
LAGITGIQDEWGVELSDVAVQAGFGNYQAVGKVLSTARNPEFALMNADAGVSSKPLGGVVGINCCVTPFTRIDLPPLSIYQRLGGCRRSIPLSAAQNCVGVIRIMVE